MHGVPVPSSDIDLQKLSRLYLIPNDMAAGDNIRKYNLTENVSDL